ncbi:Heterogeneous nuclear ribonucleoprotein u-like protein 1 [Dirofilaria immitis]|nr:Heterogeneous nuclear ribonucleoprotein u-like protein 1 [Dirofilaria immitis]
MEAEKAFVPHCISNTNAVSGEPFHMLEAERSPISNDETKCKMELIPSQRKKLRISPNESKLQELKCDKKTNEKETVEEELTSSSDDEELKWLYKTRRGKKSRKNFLEEGQTFANSISKNDDGIDEIADPSVAKLISEENQMIRKEDERSSRERSSKSFSMESLKTGNSVNVNEKSAKALIPKGPIRIKFKTNLLKTTIEKTSELKRKEIPPCSIGLITKDEKMNADATLVNLPQAVLFKWLCPEKMKRGFTPPLSSQNTEKTKDQTLPPVDVLDSIFDKQAQLLSSKYKTEQERALERQKLEMEKRRQNAVPSVISLSTASSTGLEKRRHVDFVLPSKSSLEELVVQQHSICSIPSDFRSNLSPSSHQIRESTSMEEKRLLAQLPPPPPPPPLLSCSKKRQRHPHQVRLSITYQQWIIREMIISEK